LGYEEETKSHFMDVNKCTELEYAAHLTQAQLTFEQQNKVYRWKLVADLTKFGLKNATIKERNIPFIKSAYDNVDWKIIPLEDKKKLFQFHQFSPPKYWFTPPKVISINIDNYQGIIEVVSDDVNKIVWFLDKQKIKTNIILLASLKLH